MLGDEVEMERFCGLGSLAAVVVARLAASGSDGSDDDDDVEEGVVRT